jgi:hypothetical protein
VGCYLLYDYKTSGSFKVALALGLEKSTEEITDDAGDTLYYKTGTRKGQPKTRQSFVPNREKAIPEILDWTFQMNRYRILVEDAGYPISRMITQCIPRDGNTLIAKNRGVDKNVILIDIPRMDNDKCLSHYANLQAEIMEAFKTFNPRICNDRECWSGRKCSGYCPVSEQCKQMEKEGRIFTRKSLSTLPLEAQAGE